MRITLLVLLIAVLGRAAAQTIVLSGQVVDEAGSGVEFATLSVRENPARNTVADGDGAFRLSVPSGEPLTLQVSGVRIEPTEIAVDPLFDDATLVVRVRSRTVQVGTVDIEARSQREREEVGTVRVEVDPRLPNPSGNFETLLLAQVPGLRSNNELSSTYSVRGGNYDENLVYVNGFEVYRPFLIRSGQQEGLSFINPDMVGSVSFSSGGFQARYGDRMSSVLDVEYRRPEHFGGSASGSLLGGTAHIEGASRDHRFGFILGARNKSMAYLLGAQDVTGQYTPRFFDAQGFLYAQITERTRLEYLFNVARNRFDFVPEDRTTDFGLVNTQVRFQVAYDGQENDRYLTAMNGLSLIVEPHDDLDLRFLGGVFLMNERERFDLIGEYFLGEVETDITREDFNEVRRFLGAGTFHDWAANELRTRVYQAAHRGRWRPDGHDLSWGVTYKHERIDDRLSEWQRIDSAGYALPNNPDRVLLNDVVKGQVNLNSHRISGFVQNTHRWGDSTRVTLNYGARLSWWSVNRELVASPRAQLAVRPNTRADLVFTAGGGLYQQPPFYREMRDLTGRVNTDLQAQRSVHAIVGMDYGFRAWDRPFRLITEAWYKYMWDLVPYEFDNVLIRYFGRNAAKGYAAGVDMRLHGELAEGMESWVSLSLLKTEEDVEDDIFYQYLVERTLTETDTGFVTTTDSLGRTVVAPGNIPRPTDSRFGISLFFQDYIPGLDFIRAHFNFTVAGGLPFGPPDGERFGDVFRIPAYRRFDMGVSALLYDKQRVLDKGKVPKKVMQRIDRMWLSLEFYNLFAIQNTVSYLWVRGLDVGTGELGQYAVPNYLTDRRVNLRFRVDF